MILFFCCRSIATAPEETHGDSETESAAGLDEIYWAQNAEEVSNIEYIYPDRLWENHNIRFVQI